MTVFMLAEKGEEMVNQVSSFGALMAGPDQRGGRGKTLGRLLRFLSRKVPLTLDEAVDQFLANPSSAFRDKKGPLWWPSYEGGDRWIGYTELTVEIGGHKLGQITDVLWNGRNARIGHFAVQRSVVRRGIGTVLARAIAHELAARYCVDRVVFSESHRHFHSVGYDSFFRQLGATPLPISDRQQRTDRHDYQWLSEHWGE